MFLHQSMGHVLLLKVAVRRRKLRTAAGALTVSLPEADIHVGPTNCEEPNISIRALDQEGSTSRQLVAELMILANEAVGVFGAPLWCRKLVTSL